MRTVIYETHNAIFDFELPDVIGRLKYYSEQKVRDATELLQSIVSCTSPSPAVNVTTDYFGFIVLDLLGTNKGHAYCKTCKETYNPCQLRSIPLGFGKTPFLINIKPEGGIIKRLFGRKRLICGRGGETYECPKGHKLISAITWIGTLRIQK